LTALRVATEASASPSLGDALRADGVEQAAAVLPSSRQVVPIPVYVRREAIWTGVAPTIPGGTSNRQLYTHDGAAFHPELLVVRLLEEAGWGAAWRRSWNGVSYLRGVGETVELGALARNVVAQITRQAGYDGSWDIIAWRDRELRLLASRPAGGQRISAYMADWLDAAMRMGVPSGCFAVVEHDAPRPPRARRR
jgi:hypothetical protein